MTYFVADDREQASELEGTALAAPFAALPKSVQAVIEKAAHSKLRTSVEDFASNLSDEDLACFWDEDGGEGFDIQVEQWVFETVTGCLRKQELPYSVVAAMAPYFAKEGDCDYNDESSHCAPFAPKENSPSEHMGAAAKSTILTYALDYGRQIAMDHIRLHDLRPSGSSPAPR